MVNEDAGSVLTILDDIEHRVDELRAVMGQPRLDLEVRRALGFLDLLSSEEVQG